MTDINTGAAAVAPSNLRGMGFMLAGVAAFAFMDASLKMLAPHYPPMQVAALRALSSLPLVSVWVMLDGGPAQLLRVRWSLHLLRGLLSVVMLGAFAYALRTLPLAEAYSLFFIAPLLVTALAVPLLGERVDWRSWLAIAIGFSGTVIVLRPTGAGVLTLGGIAVLASAAGYSLSSILVRILGRTDSTQSLVFWMLAMTSFFCGALAWPQWQPIQAEHWHVLFWLGVTGMLGQYAITVAFKCAAASRIVPFEYTAMVWGIGLDAFFWNTWPNTTMLIGAGVIIGSGLYVIFREHVSREAEHP